MMVMTWLLYLNDNMGLSLYIYIYTRWWLVVWLTQSPTSLHIYGSAYWLRSLTLWGRNEGGTSWSASRALKLRIEPTQGGPLKDTLQSFSLVRRFCVGACFQTSVAKGHASALLQLAAWCDSGSLRFISVGEGREGKAWGREPCRERN